ncbi:MAG: DNA double-strand break repair nuclease NurA [Promethearchaeota archaeon]
MAPERRVRDIPPLDYTVPRIDLDGAQQHLLRHVLFEMPEKIREKAQDFLIPYYKFITDEFYSYISKLTDPLPLIDKIGDSFGTFTIRDIFPQAGDPFIFFKSEGRSYIHELLKFLSPGRIVGVDESKVETEILAARVVFLRSLGFVMTIRPGERNKEDIYPLLSNLTVQTDSEVAFDLKVSLSEYIRNLIICLMAIHGNSGSGTSREQVTPEVKVVFLHGPLVRAIGPFSKIAYSYREASTLLQTQTERLLSDFNRFCDTCACMKKGERGCCDLILDLTADLEHALTHKELREKYGELKEENFKEKIYPGLCLYFFLLKNLYDTSQEKRVYMIACPENIRSAEFLSLVGPSLLLYSLKRQINSSMSNLKKLLECYTQIKISDPPDSKSYAQIIQLLNLLNLTDTKVFTYFLLDGQYTTPIEIQRYRGKNDNRRRFHVETGLDTRPTQVVEAIFPREQYQICMAFLRTTPLQAPLRVEFFNLPFYDFDFLMRLVYIFSLPYRSYGLPLPLKYADMLSRLPKKLVKIASQFTAIELLKKANIWEADLTKFVDLVKGFSRGFEYR